MCHDFFSFFSESLRSCSKQPYPYKSCCVQHRSGVRAESLMPWSVLSLRFIILPGIWRTDQEENTLPFQCCWCSQMCVFCRVILVVLWCVSVQGSGLWWALSLGKKHLWPPFPCSLCPHLPATLLDRQDYCPRTPVWIRQRRRSF